MPTTPADPAYLAEQYVLTRLLDEGTGFNWCIQQLTGSYGLPPFRLDYTSPFPNLFVGRYIPADIQKAVGGASTLSYPLAILSVDKISTMGEQTLRITPSTFSGQIIVSVDFYVAYPQVTLPVNGNAMFRAVAGAFTTALCSPDSYIHVPAGLGFNNEVLAEQGRMEWDGARWTQYIPCAASFNGIV